MAMLFIHAINPFGFSWCRRVTEEGCDLNRNYLDFSENIKGLSTNTIKSYQRDLMKFSRFSESADINNFEMFSEEICSGWIADLFQQDVSARSIQRHISTSSQRLLSCLINKNSLKNTFSINRTRSDNRAAITMEMSRRQLRAICG
mgnify:CR=1 FL=1